MPKYPLTSAQDHTVQQMTQDAGMPRFALEIIVPAMRYRNAFSARPLGDEIQARQELFDAIDRV